jgi:hypothetical protein
MGKLMNSYQAGYEISVPTGEAIFFGSILLASVIFVWAIVTVELIHPVNVQINYDASRCPRCPKGFETVPWRMLSGWWFRT